MIKDPTFKEILDLFKEIRTIVFSQKWRDKSDSRTRILVSKKLDHLKWMLGEIPDDKLFSSDEAALFIENVLEIINEVLIDLPKHSLNVAYYELELFRLRYASMYALSYGRGGELQVAGAAHALANVLMGISTLDVEELFVEWDHPEFNKRKKLILNYLSSAFLFFFSLCDSLNLIYKQDLEYWLTEGINAAVQYFMALEKLWDIPLTISLQRKMPGPRNYSPYYAVYAMLDTIISFILDFQRFFFDERIVLPDFKDFLDLSEPESFFDSLYNLIAKAEYYVEDLKKHVKKGSFGLNENPLEDDDVKNTINELHITKIAIRGEHALYRAVSKDVISELNILENSVLPEFFTYLDKYRPLMEQEGFIDSEMADAFSSMLEELLLYSGYSALRTKNTHYLEKIEYEYAIFFTDGNMERYPRLNGLYTMVKLTLDLESNKLDNVEHYAERFEKLSVFSAYEPRNAFAFSLIANILKLKLGLISNEQFMNKINEKHEQFYMSFPPHLNNEIEIYKQNLELALANQETSFSMKRLTNIRHYDPYTIFIPDISKIPANDTTADILYLPFNLMQDYIAEPQIEQKPLGKQVAVIGEETLGADFDKL
ncbi:MAG: hypothetical protein ACTSYD_01700 [Candidatus Heimdallarchaeaceae archaeon]